MISTVTSCCASPSRSPPEIVGEAAKQVSRDLQRVSSAGAEQLRELAERPTGVPGVVGVLLGGSRARGEHTPDSDDHPGVEPGRRHGDPVYGEKREVRGDTGPSDPVVIRVITCIVPETASSTA